MPIRIVKRIGVILSYASGAKGKVGENDKKKEAKRGEFQKAFKRLMSRFRPESDEEEKVTEGGRKDAKDK